MKNILLLSIAIFLLPIMNLTNAQEQEKQEEEFIITFAVGSYEISTLSEGQQVRNSEILVDASAEILSQCIPEGNYSNATNAFLVRTQDKIILIDAGHGRKLFDNMLSRNVTAEKVDIILLTHMHGDHIGGLLQDGKVAFPNAELYLSQPEYDYWMSDQARGGGVQARAVIEAYKDKLHLFTPTEIETGGISLFSGFQAIATPGHTPGHTSFLFESEGEKMLIWGDLTHAMAVQIPYPEVAVTYDVDSKMAIETRKKVLDYVSKHKIPVAGMHIAFPAIGNITKDGNGYSFKELCLCLGI